MVRSGAALGAPTRRRREGRSRWLVAVLAFLVILAAAWTALWYYAVSRAGTVLDAVIAREATHKRIWTCPDRSFHGYPLKIDVSCREPTFEGRWRGRLVKAHVMALRATVAFADPNRVIVDVDGPLQLQIGGDADIQATWKTLQVNAKGPFGFNRATLDIDQPKLKVELPYVGSGSGAAASASMRVYTLDPPTPHKPDLKVIVAVNDIASDLLDQNFGSSEAANVDAVGMFSETQSIRGGSLPEWLDSWRESGGRLAIDAGSFRKGVATIELGGNLSFDHGHRLDGDLTVGLTRMDGLLGRLELPPNAAAIGTMLAAALGGKPTTKVALKLSGGRVYWGMIPLPLVLRQIY